MNVLYFGSTEGTACALHYYSAMVRLGFNVLPFSPNYFKADNPLEKIRIRLNKGPTPQMIQKVSDRLIGLCKRNQFDVIFVMAENYLHRDTMDAIRKVSPSPPLFLYHSHDNNFSSGICKPKDFFETLANYDFAYTTKSQNVARYKKIGQKNAHFIPSAYEPMVHRPIAPVESLYQDDIFDLVFIGTYDYSRDAYMEKLGWNKLEVWGSDWQRYPNFGRYKNRIHPYPIYFFEFADVMSHCKCSLGLLREEAEDLHTQRTFEIPACGALQISPRNDEILSFFKENEEIVCFESKEELREKCEYYLKHEEPRKKIAEKGFRKCIEGKHSYMDRVSDMFRIANQKKKIHLSEGVQNKTLTA